jgi:CheY-like chemotaxis protein
VWNHTHGLCTATDSNRASDQLASLQVQRQKKMIILIVEDNATVRRLIREVLGESADTLVECTDGAEAAEAYATHQPDLVLMDIRMPRLDGLAATRQVVKRFPEARVVMLTDYDEDDLRVAAAKAGARGYALKHNLTSLESLVEQIRSERTQARPQR